jgi:hypothetical protein
VGARHNFDGCGRGRVARYVVVSGILLVKSEISKFVRSNTKKTKASAEDGLRRLLHFAEAVRQGISTPLFLLPVCKTKLRSTLFCSLYSESRTEA